MSRNSVLTDEQSKLNARLEAHMVYICPECGKAFRTQAEWRQHLNLVCKHTFVYFIFIAYILHYICRNMTILRRPIQISILYKSMRTFTSASYASNGWRTPTKRSPCCSIIILCI